jgi:hypothetical protein
MHTIREHGEKFIRPTFLNQFQGYYRLWEIENTIDSSHVPDSSQFSKAVNSSLQNLRVEGESLDEAAINTIMAGNYIPSPQQILAISLVFDLYGFERDDFAKQAIKSTEDAAQRRRGEILPLRRTNPGSNTKLPSFAEMLEDSYRAKRRQNAAESINTLLWDRVFKTWAQDGRDMSPEQFCALIAENNRGKHGKTHLSNEAIYGWRNHPDKFKLYAQSIEAMCKAFVPMPENTETAKPGDNAHEWMLWHIISGRAFKNPYPPADPENDAGTYGKSELDTAIEAAQATSDHGRLVRELIDASGISVIRLRALLAGCQQLTPWRRNAYVKDLAMAQRFLDIVHPPELQESPAEAKKQNGQMLDLITGRTFDLPTLMEKAQKEGIENPGGQLFMLLTGRKGIVSISEHELFGALKKRGQDVSEHKLKRMRSSLHNRGGNIIEAIARSILDLVKEKSGVAITAEQVEECVDILTNCPSASKLLKQCIAQTLTIAQMMRMSYERKGMTQEEFNNAVGLSNVSDFLMGKKHLGHESASNIARWMSLKSEQHRQFIVLATGHEAALDPVAILYDVRCNEVPRLAALRLILDASGMTRGQLAEASGVDMAYCTQTRSGGRIKAPVGNMEALAGLCGLKGFEDEFIHAFSTQWVSRMGGTSINMHSGRDLQS